MSQKQKTINILIPFKDKMNYLTLLLCTLKEAIKRYPKVKIFLCDTNANNTVPSLAIDMPVIFKSFKPFPNITTMYLYIIPIIFQEIEDDNLMLIEADAVVHPEIFITVNKMIKELPDMRYGSVFNTKNHPAIKKVKDEYLKKDCMGFFGSIINRQSWNSLKIEGGIDWSYCRHVRNQNMGIYCTNRSYIEHMGFSGAHYELDKGVRLIERSINFFD